MTLTHDKLHAVATSGSGFNKEQLAILGLPPQPPRGWLRRLIGTQIADSDYEKLLSLKGAKRWDRKSVVRLDETMAETF